MKRYLANLAHPYNGRPADQIKAKTLNPNAWYDVETVVVYDAYSDVYLVGAGGPFNSVLFEFIDADTGLSADPVENYQQDLKAENAAREWDHVLRYPTLDELYMLTQAKIAWRQIINSPHVIVHGTDAYFARVKTMLNRK